MGDVTIDNGLMFDQRGEFPTLAAVDREPWHLDLYSIDTEPFEEWLAIAVDPTRVTYFDDDREAMDETNYAVLLDDLTTLLRDDDREQDIPSVFASYASPGGTGPMWVTTGTEDALAAGVAVIGQVLAVASDNADAIDAMREAKRALADYPLLDDEAYSEREWDAWAEYAPTAWTDEIRDAVRSGWMDDDTAEALEDADAGEMVGALSSDLHYSYGFSGEYGPPFLELFASRLADVLVSVTF
jgi:hypothetical protein